MIKKITFTAMGSQMMAALEVDPEQAEIILPQVPQWIEEWEQSLSRFRPDSELSRLNRSQGKMIRVSETFWDVLNLSLQTEHTSQGLVTPAVLNALEAAGYSKDFDLIRSGGFQINQEFTSKASLEDLIILEKEKLVLLPKGLRLDFGGVAKGWAAQRVVDKLQKYGPTLMDAGGDIMSGSALLDGSPWPIAIGDPFQPEDDLEMLYLAGEGVATSGQDYRIWSLNGTRMHHIIDIRTGRPAESDVFSVTVVAPDVIQAEMAAKVVLILGSEEGLSWLEDQPDHAGYIVRMDNSKLISKHLSSYCWSKTCQNQ
jgi:thiamine biosynthesis lipoprotein